jgi:hypothetical protein
MSFTTAAAAANVQSIAAPCKTREQLGASPAWQDLAVASLLLPPLQQAVAVAAQ